MLICRFNWFAAGVDFWSGLCFRGDICYVLRLEVESSRQNPPQFSKTGRHSIVDEAKILYRRHRSFGHLLCVEVNEEFKKWTSSFFVLFSSRLHVHGLFTEKFAWYYLWVKVQRNNVVPSADNQWSVNDLAAWPLASSPSFFVLPRSSSGRCTRRDWQPSLCSGECISPNSMTPLTFYEWRTSDLDMCPTLQRSCSFR